MDHRSHYGNVSTKFLDDFIAINAHIPQNLVELLLSLFGRENGVDSDAAVNKALDVCLQSLAILQSRKKELNETLSVHGTTISQIPTLSCLSSDSLNSICQYLDSKSKVRFRLTSNMIFVNLMRCDIDLTDVITSTSLPIKEQISTMINIRWYRNYGFQYHGCHCQASEDLRRLVNVGCVVKRGAIEHVSQVRTMGFDYPWTITGIPLDLSIRDGDLERILCQLLELDETSHIHRVHINLENGGYLLDQIGQAGQKLLLPYLKEVYYTHNSKASRKHRSGGDLNMIGDVVSLETLNLKNLNICGNIASISKLVHVCYLNLDFCPIQGDISIFEEFENLKFLSLWDNDLVGDISCFSKLIRLDNLVLGGNPAITGNLMSLSLLQNLTFLSFGETNLFGDLSSLLNLTLLSRLSFDRTQVSGDLSSLKSLFRMKTLFMCDNKRIRGNLSQLSGLNKLSCVFLCGTNVEGEVQSLTSLSRLRMLDLSRSQVNKVFDSSMLVAHTAIGPAGSQNIFKG